MQDLKATVHPLFAVPMLEAVIPGHEQLNRALAAEFLDMEAKGDTYRDPVRRDTQSGLFESHFYLHQNRHPAIQHLFKYIDGTLTSFVRGLAGGRADVPGEAGFRYSMWFHVTRTGGYQGTHNHGNASWSGIYCVDPGDPVPSQPNSGAVRFQDPRVGAGMHRDPANEHMVMPYTLTPLQRLHKAGHLVVFPSYLYHEIFPYAGQRPRIVVAFNAWVPREV